VVKVVSILTPEEAVALGGLPGKAVVGSMIDVPGGGERFQPNPAFAEFMHDVIRAVGPGDPGLCAAAMAQGEGWVYVIDLRTPDGPQGRVPAEDIVGGFAVSNGRIVEGSYWANEAHVLLTRNGVVCLPEVFRRAMLERLKELPGEHAHRDR
jgi:hypothetical protein